MISETRDLKTKKKEEMLGSQKSELKLFLSDLLELSHTPQELKCNSTLIYNAQFFSFYHDMENHYISETVWFRYSDESIVPTMILG